MTRTHTTTNTTSSDWYVLATAGGYVGRDESGAIVANVPLSDAAAFATEDRAVEGQAMALRVLPEAGLVTIHAVDSAWVNYRFGTIPAV